MMYSTDITVGDLVVSHYTVDDQDPISIVSSVRFHKSTFTGRMIKTIDLVSLRKRTYGSCVFVKDDHDNKMFSVLK